MSIDPIPGQPELLALVACGIVGHVQTADLAVWAWAAASLVVLCYAGFFRLNGLQGRIGRRDVSGVPIAAWLVCALAVMAAQGFGYSLALFLTGDGAAGGVGDDPRSAAVLGIVSSAAGVLAGITLIAVLLPRARNAGLLPGWKDLPVGLAGLFLAFPVLLTLSQAGVWAYTLVNGTPPPEIAHPVLSQIKDRTADPWTWGVVATAVIGAPIVEELVYRAFLQSALVLLTRRAAGGWLAVLVTAAVFALSHRLGNSVPWHAIPVLFVLGIAAGAGYERTRRLGVPMVIHMAFNALNIAAVLLSG